MPAACSGRTRRLRSRASWAACPTDVVDGWVRDAAGEAAARGIVGVVDFEMTWNRDVWLRRIAGGFDSLRVDAGVYPEDLERAAAAGCGPVRTARRRCGAFERGPAEGADRRVAQHPHRVLRGSVSARRPGDPDRERSGAAVAAGARPGVRVRPGGPCDRRRRQSGGAGRLRRSGHPRARSSTRSLCATRTSSVLANWA